MSEKRCSVQRAGCRVLLLAALVILPATLQGQSAGELEARVRRLEGEVAQARREEDSLRALEADRAMARFIRVRSGGLELLTIAELGETVEQGGRMAWDVLSLTYQDSVAAILRQYPISVLPKPPTDSPPGRVWFPPHTRLVFATEEDPVRGLAISLLAQVSQDLWLHQDQALRDWMKSPPPITTDLSGAFAAAYLDLATSAAPVAQRCLTDSRACGEALALARPADPAAEWYSPAGRRQLVVQLSAFLQPGESRQSYDRCVEGSDQDCLALLRGVPDLIPSSLLPPTRTTFLRVVLEHGGPGSYPVLLSSAGQPMEARFRRSSGLAREQVLADWHQRVIAARPPPTTMRGGQAFAAVAWSVILLSFGLRSSRWR